MKINPVKQFVQNNISRFVKSGERYPENHMFYLYDKNNVYRGEYFYKRFPTRNFYGVITRDSMATTRIMNDKLKQEMGEIVYIDKEYARFYNPQSEDLLKIKKITF